MKYSNSSLQCTSATHHVDLPPTCEIADEAATALVKLRDGKNEIELQEAELHFKNADVVYRTALRAAPGCDGLMELDVACPASLSTESTLSSDLTDCVTMVDAP